MMAPIRDKGMRWLELDGALLGFDRSSGRNLLLRGEETAHFVQRAPRVVQMSLTNACNKSCGFCYRPQESPSDWNFETALEFAKFLSSWGVLELALGGGEPTVFPRFPELAQRIWSETKLALNFTSNGKRLNDTLLGELRGSVGQIQLSVYDDEDVDSVIGRLLAHKIRFGLNYLVTPSRLRRLDADLLRWADMGVRDVLLLSYKGKEALHLSSAELVDLDRRIVRMHDHLKPRLQLKVDVCWSSRLPSAPQMFFDEDCRAGALFLSVSSDRRVLACSFAEGGIKFRDHSELLAIYQRLKAAQPAAELLGCTRLPTASQERLAILQPRLHSFPEAR